MAAFVSALLLLGASTVVAGPLFPRQGAAAVTVTVTAAAPTSTAWDAGAVHDYPIHASCNATQHAYIKKGLDETMLICSQARNHILRWGNTSEIYQKYFGDGLVSEPLGWYTKIVDGDKSDVLFRCDDIDGNCEQPGWAGHWRGQNGTSETVLCDLSYEIRKPLNGMCMFGYNVANGATNFYWASDLLHRLLHIPKVSEGVVGHYNDEEMDKYLGVVSLAKMNSTYAARNSDTLQYFALEVYAHDVAVPGIGCAGTYNPLSFSTVAPASSASAVVGASTMKTPAAASATLVTAAASAAPTEACEPHGNHWHCPPGVPEPTSPPA
ncbi:zincin [Clathrospora elynae]|uniref:Zincin n=1 Tax=Clathrospora elynae TaxID=706981 RepID=A0A6A5SVB8_9PLEO|nr:zincin [Clathrospora elynae]